jgi:hypothetical protein
MENSLEQALNEIAEMNSRLDLAEPFLKYARDLSEIANSLIKLGFVDEAITVLSVVHALTKTANSLIVQ